MVVIQDSLIHREASTEGSLRSVSKYKIKRSYGGGARRIGLEAPIKHSLWKIPLAFLSDAHVVEGHHVAVWLIQAVVYVVGVGLVAHRRVIIYLTIIVII